MGELIIFPGSGLPAAEVDWDHLDSFRWTPALLVEYAERAAELERRCGGHESVRLPRWPAGPPCQDCGRTTHRVRVRSGRLLLCAECGRSRACVAISLKEEAA